MSDLRKAVMHLCVVMALLCPGFSHAGSDADRIHDVVTRLGSELMTDPNLPGLSVAVLKKGEDTPVCVTFGTACVENNVPMTPASRIKIGSVTKVFTAALIHKLIEDGRLEYETTIDRFFPQFPNGKSITVRNLVNHTSGIVDMLSLPAVQTNLTKAWSAEELINMAGAAPALFAPGAKQKYSNTGYLMLAVISEIVSGKTYEDEIRDMFYEGLGMKSLSVGRDQAIVPNLSCGYSASADAVLTLPLMAGLAMAKGTGNLVAAPGDVVRLVNLGRVLKTNILDSTELSPLRLADGECATFRSKEEGCRYSGSFLDGCTLFMFDEPKIMLAGKLGSFPGFGTAFFYDRQSTFAVVISVNNERSMPKAISLGAKILHELRN